MLYQLTVSSIGSNWNHFVITWSSSKELLVYKNGEKTQATTTSSSGSFSSLSGSKLRVGFLASADNDYVQIQNLKLWELALSYEEISELYSPGIPINS